MAVSIITQRMIRVDFVEAVMEIVSRNDGSSTITLTNREVLLIRTSLYYTAYDYALDDGSQANETRKELLASLYNLAPQTDHA